MEWFKVYRTIHTYIRKKGRTCDRDDIDDDDGDSNGDWNNEVIGGIWPLPIRFPWLEVEEEEKEGIAPMEEARTPFFNATCEKDTLFLIRSKVKRKIEKESAV